jgi:HNH endonuclease
MAVRVLGRSDWGGGPLRSGHKIDHARFVGLAARFWAKVDRSGGPDACWPWTASVFKDRGGYGKFQAGASRATARVVYAHRFAYELAVGSVPDHLLVCHTCDNPPCVNPAHLFPGTHLDNMQDCVAKGRHVTPPRLRGEAHPGARVNKAIVMEVRERYVSGERGAHIARALGLSRSLVYDIINRRTWRHLA